MSHIKGVAWWKSPQSCFVLTEHLGTWRVRSFDFGKYQILMEIECRFQLNWFYLMRLVIGSMPQSTRLYFASSGMIFLKEEKCYSFENMGIVNNCGGYRTTRHSYKLNFQFSFKVQYLLNLNIIKSPYQLIPIYEVIGETMTLTIWLVIYLCILSFISLL